MNFEEFGEFCKVCEISEFGVWNEILELLRNVVNFQILNKQRARFALKVPKMRLFRSDFQIKFLRFGQIFWSSSERSAQSGYPSHLRRLSMHFRPSAHFHSVTGSQTMPEKEKVSLLSSHGVWKSQKKSHSTLRAKRATFTFWVDKSCLKMPKMVHFGEFLKTSSLRSNSVTRQVSFYRTKKNWWKMPKFKKFKCDILSNFQTMCYYHSFH